VVLGSTALALGSGTQLSVVATILLGGMESTALVPLALTAGLATFGMVAAIRAWSARDWGVAVAVASLELLVAAWLFGFEPIGWLLVVLFSIALLGLARSRSWFQRSDDDLAR
jgi:hypothetical protein